MKDKLITNNNDNQENIIFKEVKKMLIIKYLNLFFAIIRILFMFFLLSLLLYFPSSVDLTSFVIMMLIYRLLIFPIFSIMILFEIILGIIRRNFIIKKNESCIDSLRCLCICWWCLCEKNVVYYKLNTLLFSIVTFIWSFYLLYHFMYLESEYNKVFFFEYKKEKVFLKIVIYFIDALLLLSQSYCFYYYEYFLKRCQIYLEFYKHLIIKNRNKEADFIRNELPINIEELLINSGTEMNDI